MALFQVRSSAHEAQHEYADEATPEQCEQSCGPLGLQYSRNERQNARAALNPITKSYLTPEPRLQDCLIRCIDHVELASADWPDARQNDTADDYYARSQHHIFQTTSFLHIWEKTYAPALNAQLCLVEIRHPDETPLLFLPLAITRNAGTKILSFTDHGVADYNAPVLFETPIHWDETKAEQLWQLIQSALPDFDLINFENMPEKIGHLLNPLFLLGNDPANPSCHSTTLNRPWAAILKTIRRPKNIRRNLRKLNELGSCEFIIAADDAERQELLAFMLREKQQRFIETNVPGFEQYPQKLHYFNYATEVFSHVGALHLSALRVNGEIIACMWGLICGKHYYGIMIASKLDLWGSYSPGYIIHYQLLEHLHQHGYHCLDLGVGDEAWKLQNCDLTIPLVKLSRSITLRGRLYEHYRRSMVTLRATRLWQYLRPLKWRLLRTKKQTQ